MAHDLYVVISAYAVPLTIMVTGLTVCAIYEFFFMKG